jgi:hypothetical protein
VGLHVIYTKSAMFLSKKAYPSWRAIQDELPEYKTSLGPWSPTDMIEYLHEEYSDLYPDAATQVEALLRSSEPLLEVTFRG